MNDAGKVAFTPRGTYLNSETYEYLDTVVYDGNAYAAKKITMGNAPSDPDNEYWALLARGGESVPAATKDRAGIVKLAYHEDVTEPGTYALDAVQANTEVQGTLAHQVLKHNAALINKLSRDNISSSSAVTYKGTYVLDAVEKNASVAGTLANQIAEQNTNLINKIYPIGSIYMSVNNVSPVNFIGGAWEPLKDRFLLGASNAYGVNSTGGETAHQLTVAEMPYGFPINRNILADMGTTGEISMGVAMGASPAGAWKAAVHSIQGGLGYAHNNMPPYLAVYMWKRIA